MHPSKSRLKKIGSKPQISAGRRKEPREAASSLPPPSREELKGAAVAASHTGSCSNQHPGSRPEGLPAGTLRSRKSPLCSNNSHSGSNPNRVMFSPYLWWEAKSTRRAKCHLEPENLSFLEPGLLNSFGLPTVQKGAGDAMWPYSCASLPSVQLAFAHLA